MPDNRHSTSLDARRNTSVRPAGHTPAEPYTPSLSGRACPNLTRHVFPENPHGEKILHEGGRAVLRPSAQTFFAGGRGARKRPRTRTAPPVRPKRSAGHRCQRARKAPRFCWHFGHRLATMAGMAKALEIAAVREHCPVSAVRLDVVHFRGRVRSPRRAHSRQKGSRRSCPGRRSSVHSGVRYIQCQDLAASLRLSLGRWRSQ